MVPQPNIPRRSTRVSSRARNLLGAGIMATILSLVAGHHAQRFHPGDIVIDQGSPGGPLFVLLAGEVEVLRDNIRVAKASAAGAVFGEMSFLLQSAHTATVRALVPCEFAVIDDAREFLRSSPDASLHVAELLARRLDSLNRYLIDVKRQYEGHDHLGMVDDVLETLMHRPRPSINA
jgi:CRP-like cAMP-binding protein